MASEISILNGLNREYRPQLLHRIFEENLSSCENEVAIISNDGSDKLTYKQLNDEANRVAATLIDQIKSYDLKPNGDGDWIVAVCMPPNNELIITLLAILKAGAAYLPFAMTFPKSRIDHILEEAKPSLVIYDEHEIDRSIFGNAAAASFDEYRKLSLNYSDNNISNAQMLKSKNDDCLAIVLYTSGSTGQPKGVRISHSSILYRFHWLWETFPYTSTEQVCVFKSTLTFVDAVAEIWSTLLCKKTVLVVPTDVAKDPSQLVTILEKYKIERLFVVPTALKTILIYLSLKKDQNLLKKLKLWITAGEILSASLANEFFDYFPENEYILCNSYGSTEIHDISYFLCLGREQLRKYNGSVPIGRPIYNTAIYLLDDERKPIKFGQIGEIYVSSVSLASGYVNGRDQDRFIDNILSDNPKFRRMYQTGDYASLREDGIIHYEGRKDSQVKIRGHRVDLSEIEKYLFEILGVKRCIVLCYHPDQIDQAILAFASVESTSKLDASKIEKLLRNELSEYMRPHVILVDQFPLLINGKIDRQALLKMYENGFSNNDDAKSAIDYDFTGVPPYELQMARDLFEIIGEVVAKTTRLTISMESNFYDLGGNSLNSIYTVAKLRDRGYYIETTNFICAKNLRDVLNHITGVDDNDSKHITACETEGMFTAEPLQIIHKREAIHILAKSFTDKNLLSQHVTPKLKYSDLVEVYDVIWQSVVDIGYSFIIKDKANRIVGVALNFDYDIELDIPYNEPCSVLNKYLHFLESSVINQFPEDKTIFYADVNGTHESLSTKENIIAMTMMENETIRIAKEKNFWAILTTNTSALTHQLATHIFGYETLLDHRANQYVIDGKKPFATAPDSCHNFVQWKKL